MAYDAARDRTVLFGGYDGTSISGETWELEDARWERRDIDGPSARLQHAMAFDEARGVTVLHGGLSKPGEGCSLIDEDNFDEVYAYCSDTWTFDGARWTRVALDGPSPRAFHAMAYDRNRQVIVLVGGGDDDCEVPLDVWEWNGTAWATIPAAPESSWRANEICRRSLVVGRRLQWNGAVARVHQRPRHGL
jgi:hypothetical protein